MKEITLYNNYYDAAGGNIRITSIDMNKLEDFEKVIRIFRDYPYYEILSEKDCEDELACYQDNKGIAFGCYLDDNIVGVNCVEYGYDKSHNHSVDFNIDYKKVAYFSGLTMLERNNNLYLRRKGLGTLLVTKTDEYLQNLKDKDGLKKFLCAYARVMRYESKSRHIFERTGFSQAYNNSNQPIVDVCTYKCNLINPKTNDYCYNTDERTYLIKKYKQ